ncbi:MAG: hypothetical protein LBU14_03810 [Candidatus Peribacteria bacterium]|nr:hypothetical protein [Candidatus Peribacteria bacterium]
MVLMKRLLKIFIVFLYLLQISQVFAEESKMYINYNNREYIFDDPWLDSYSSTVLKGEHKIYS